MITKRGKTFWLDIWCGPKRVRRSLHTTERVVALERAQRVAEELRRPRPAGVQIAEFIPRYLDWARQSKPASARDERLRAEIIKSWAYNAGLLTLEVITPFHVEQFRAALLTRRVGKTAKTISRSTVNRYTAQLRTMFNKAKDWGEFKGENPVSRVKFYREGAKIRPLTDAEADAVLAEADRLAALKHATPLQREAPRLFRFVLQTGLRRSEALHLRWSDIGDDSITVKGKGGKVRTIPLNAAARGLLDRPRTGAYVFDVPGRDSPAVFKCLHKTISDKVGFRFHAHLLRHKFASSLLERGIDIVTIGELMGHSAVMVTMLYAHTNPRMKRSAVDSLGTFSRHPSQHSKAGKTS